MLGEHRLREVAGDLQSVAPDVAKMLQGQPIVVVPYTEDMAACDHKIAMLFGGNGSTAATSVDIATAGGIYSGRIIDRSDHLYQNGVFHLYTDEKGSHKKVGLYVPKGAKFVSPTRETAGEVDGGYGKWNNDFTFHFSQGKYAGVTIIFVHVAGTYGGKFGAAYLGKEFINSKNELIGDENQTKTSVQIGYIGGLGGISDSGLYVHCHIVVKKNGTRIDPRKVFC